MFLFQGCEQGRHQVVGRNITGADDQLRVLKTFEATHGLKQGVAFSENTPGMSEKKFPASNTFKQRWGFLTSSTGLGNRLNLLWLISWSFINRLLLRLSRINRLLRNRLSSYNFV